MMNFMGAKQASSKPEGKTTKKTGPRKQKKPKDLTVMVI